MKSIPSLSISSIMGLPRAITFPTTTKSTSSGKFFGLYPSSIAMPFESKTWSMGGYTFSSQPETFMPFSAANCASPPINVPQIPKTYIFI